MALGYPKPTMNKKHRSYISDPTVPYPFPVDLTETHRQTMLTLLMLQCYKNCPIRSPSVVQKPPKRVLEMACGSGLWSIKCHEWFAAQGRVVSFVGIDIVSQPLSPPARLAMDWTFLQHDMRRAPWPLETDTFDLVMCKDVSTSFTDLQSRTVMAELLRVLRPGGLVEIWEHDCVFRMIQPHLPNPVGAASASASASATADAAAAADAFCLDALANTPMGPPRNPYLLDYNGWVTRAFDKRGLSPVPCTLVGPWLAQESDELVVESCLRLALPLDEIRWEQGGELDEDHISLRSTARHLVVATISALGPLLTDVNGMNDYEWSNWLTDMTQDLLIWNGVRDGECLELGVWSATKKLRPGQQ